MINAVTASGQIAGFNKLSWDEFRAIQGSLDVQARTPELVQCLAARVAQVLSLAEIDPITVRTLGISFAGLVTKGTVTSTNVPVRLHCYDLAAHLRQELFQVGINITRSITLNDGLAGTLGEMRSPEGSLRSGTGMFIIWGTGVGGGAVSNGKRDSGLTEFGHTLLRVGALTDPPLYRYAPMAVLAEEGMLKENRFLLPPSGLTYLEQVVAGPWAALRFAKRALAEGLGAELQIAAKLSADELALIHSLDESTVLEWNRKVPSSLFHRLNSIVIGAPAEPSNFGSLAATARAYNLSLAREWGAAIKAIRTAHPHHQIVLGSGMAEARRSDTEFLRELNSAAGSEANPVALSALDGPSREAAGFMRKQPQ